MIHAGVYFHAPKKENQAMIKIFLIDSRPVFRLGLGSILERNAEFQVVGGAASVQEAAAKIGEVLPDIVIMDASLPGDDGIDGISVLQQKYPQARVVVLTDSEKKEDFFQAIKAGAKGYLMKNLEVSELTDSLRLVAGGSAIVYSTLAVKLLNGQNGPNGRNSDGFSKLSNREKEVLGLVARGASNKEIALQCCVSQTTVKAHLRRILEKLEVRNRAQAVAKAIERGYLTQPLS